MCVMSRARAIRGSVLVVLLATLVVSVTGCTRSIAGQPVPGGPSAARSTIPGDPSGAATPGEADRQDPGASAGVEGGEAPFDPCTIVGWQDFPGVVRPDPIEERHDPRTIPPNELTQTACMFLHSGRVDREQDAGESTVFHGTVGWSSLSSGFIDEELARPGREAVTIDGQRGVVLETANDDAQPTCVAAVELREAAGVAVVMVTNSRFTSPDARPCAISLHLLEVVLDRVGHGR